MDHGKLDRALYALKWYGSYQLGQIALIIFGAFPGSLMVLSYIFVAYDGPHTCTYVANKTEFVNYDIYIDNSTFVSYDECRINFITNTSDGVFTDHLGCVAGNTFKTHKFNSIVSEWDLVCDSSSMSQMTQILFVLGQAAGAVFCSSMSDRFGRKPTYITNIAGLLVAGIVLAFSPNYAVFATFRFISGMCQQGMDLVIATMLLETIPTEKRFKAGTFESMMWGISVVTLAPIAYLLKDFSWRYLQLTVALTATLSLVLPFKLDETLRWLLANNKTKEVNRILHKAAKINNVPIQKVMDAYNSSDKESTAKHNGTSVLLLTNDVIEVTSDENKDVFFENTKPLLRVVDVKSTALKDDKGDNEFADDNEVNNEVNQLQDSSVQIYKYTLLDILKDKVIFKNAMIVWYCWITCSIVYYGLYMSSTPLSGNRYMDYFLNAVVEVPAPLLIFVSIERYGRKSSCFVYIGIAGVSLLASVLIRVFIGIHLVARIFSTVFSLLGKLTITTTFDILFIYTPELFPTNLRNAGLGAASSVSRIGGMLAPFTSTLEKQVPWASGAIFTAMCLLAAFLIRFLPETRGQELPQTLEEVKDWFKVQTKSKK